jgi:hypothetical protein
MHLDFFKRKLLIEAMIRLANIRTKIDSWPMLQSEKSMNGDTLQGNAETMQDQLNEDILNWKRPTPLITG